MPERHDLRRGALLMVGSALLFAVMGVSVKLAAQSLPNVLVVFFRNLLGLIMLAPWLLRLGARGLRTRELPGHLARGIAGLLAMYCFFYAIGHMRLADAVLLNYSLPLFVPFVERAWLGEPMPAGIWPPILLGFAGLVVILRPGSGVFEPVALVGLAAAVFAALAQVGVRRLTKSEPVTRIVFYFGAVSTLVSAAPAALAWRLPDAAALPALLLLGASATGAQLLMTRAYSHAPAAQVGPFIYSSVVFAGVFDWLIWRRLPDSVFLAGAALVVVAGALALRREKTPVAGAPPS
jgi:drug/metabolite transporter (DMT)-like permease